MRRVKRGLCVSDGHSGSVYGMLPPNFLTFEGVPKLQNPGQEFTWKCWLHFTNQAEAFDPDFVIVNGDDIDGMQDKQKGSELCLSNWKDQRRGAIETLKVLRSVTKRAKWYFTQGCFVPGTKVLGADLQWVPVDRLEVGQDILAFDEHRPHPGGHRKWRSANITGKIVYPKPVSEVRLSDGTILTATDDHPWLVLPWPSGESYAWRRTCELIPGITRVRRIVKTWERGNDYETGWLAGIFDGEGCCHADSGGVSFTQNRGMVLDRARAAINALGFRTTECAKRPNDATTVMGIAGGLSEAIRFLGTVRPERLVSKGHVPDHGLTHTKDTLTVESVRSLGEEEIVGISTSTGTYIAEGFGAHNTPYHVGHFGEAEEDIAEAMDATPYQSVGGGRLCREVLKLDFDGVIVEAAHHISFASVYRSTPLEKESQAAQMAFAREQIEAVPDLMIRSHVHNYTNVEQGIGRVVTTPCWQLQTRHGRKASVYRVPSHLGGIYIEVDPTAKKRGRTACRVEAELYKVPPIPVTKF